LHVLTETVRREEMLDDAARLAIAAIGTCPDYVEQLYTFSDVAAHVEVIVAYLALLSAGTRAPLYCRQSLFFRHVDNLPARAQLQRGIIDCARPRLRAKLNLSLPPREFTLFELQTIHETEIGQPLDKRSFRRSVQSSGIVEPVGATRASNHCPAALYRFTGADPATGALTPVETDWSLRA
jgi:8-oxo-dGTP diphosphatase